MNIVLFILPRTVIHTAGKAAAPIGSVLPAPVEAQPIMICKKRVEYPRDTFAIPCRKIIFPLRPRKNIRPRGGRIIAMPLFACLILANLAANKTIAMLMRIKIIKRFLKIEAPARIFPEHNNERRIPHKQKIIEGCVNKIRHKSRSLCRFAKMFESKAPHFVVTIQNRSVSVPYGMGQLCLDLLVTWKRLILRLHF